MGDLSERERVWLKKIEEKEAELGEKDKELKAVQAELKEELEKAQPPGQSARIPGAEGGNSEQRQDFAAHRTAEVPRHPRGWGCVPLC